MAMFTAWATSFDMEVGDEIRPGVSPVAETVLAFYDGKARSGKEAELPSSSWRR